MIVSLTLHKHNLVLFPNWLQELFQLTQQRHGCKFRDRKMINNLKNYVTRAWLMRSSKSVDRKVWRLYIPGKNIRTQCRIVSNICDNSFHFLVFGRRFYGKQHMVQSNLAHTIRWKNSQPKKVFYTIAMRTNVSGAMCCWLSQVWIYQQKSSHSIFDVFDFII